MLNVKNIKLNMTARTKEEVIEELTDLLIQDGAVTNKEDFIRDVWLREELGSTGFENHIAIPHGKSSGVSGNDSNLLIVFYVQIMPDDLVMQLHRF